MTVQEAKRAMVRRYICSLMVTLLLPAAAWAQDSPQHSVAGGSELLASVSGTRNRGPFPFDYQFLAFRSAASDSVALWAAVSVPGGRVRAVFGGGWTYRLGIQVELFSGADPVASASTNVSHTMRSKLPEEYADGFPLQAGVRVPPGRYVYRSTVIDHNWNPERGRNVQEGEIVVPSLVASGPTVSSIAVVADTAGSWQPAPGIRLKLNASRIVRKTRRAYLYYEAYGITAGGRYRADLRVVSPGGREALQVQATGSAPGESGAPVRSADRLAIDDLAPGRYSAVVRVTDLETGRISEPRSVRFEVQELEPPPPTN